ncbi:MAG: FAD-binding oxidoreductase [Pseudomonadota bacterium]
MQSLSAIVGADAVLTAAAAAPYYSDWRGRYSGQALAVVLPADTGQVSAVVALCAGLGIAMVPQGGNTSLCGASVPLPEGEQIVLNLSRMNRIRALDAINYTVTVEAGCTLAAAGAAAEQADRLFPLGLGAISQRCEIGGNLSTNAGGTGVLRYGNMRDLVLGLEVVLPDGRIWDGLRSLRKDNTGYGLKHLFIGAEGTLGIITAAVLKLFPCPQSSASACAAVRDPAAAVALLAHLRACCGDKISAFEIVSRPCLDLVFRHIPDTQDIFAARHEWIVLIELSDVLPAPLDAPLRAGLQSFGAGVIEFAVSTAADQTEAWWKLRRNISEAQKREGLSIKHDVAVPLSRVPEFLARASAALESAFVGIRIIAFGHIGDGNIHYNASMSDRARNEGLIAQTAQVNRIVYDIVHQLDGSISAEHGIGQLKRDEMPRYKSALELELMGKIRHVFDPHNLMNPGKVI